MEHAARLEVRQTVPSARVLYVDRRDGGRLLAAWIDPSEDPDALVLALPRGGIPVGEPLATALGCEFRPVLVRKLPIPSSPEMGFGAVTADGTVTLNAAVVDAFGLGAETIAPVVAATRTEVERRSRAYPGGWPLPRLEGRRVWLVDDGLATGFSAIAVARMARAHGAEHLSLAVPCAPLTSVERLAAEVDESWCGVAQTAGSFAVASFYQDFHEMSDEEVLELLAIPGG